MGRVDLVEVVPERGADALALDERAPANAGDVPEELVDDGQSSLTTSFVEGDEERPHVGAPDESHVRLIPPAPEDTHLSKDQIRSRRRREVAGRSILLRARKSDVLTVGQEVDAEVEALRPRTRSECKGGMRPCPFILCKYHLYLDVSPRTGSIKLNFPDLDVDELKESCVLDVADRGGITIEALADIMNLTRERIRQLGVAALDKLDGDLDAGDVIERAAAPDANRRLTLFSQEDVESEDSARDVVDDEDGENAADENVDDEDATDERSPDSASL